MSHCSPRGSSASLGRLIAVASAVVLSGCSTDAVTDYVDPVQHAHYERYPIAVTTASAKLGVVAPGEKLTAEQTNAVSNFGTDAASNAHSKITIKWPSASPAMKVAARQAADLMMIQGVPQSRIRIGTYRGSSADPIRITFERKVAVTKECGDWSDDLAYSPRNTSYSNFGCAHQHNIAAVVSNPEDFERPRAMSPIDSANRIAALLLYNASPTAVTSTSSVATDIKHKTETSLSGASDN